MYRSIHSYVHSCTDSFDLILDERKQVLKSIADDLSQKRQKDEPIQLVFICTHNSRRSQFGQVWATVAASHFGIHPVNCHSAGTEETALHPNTASALQRAGFSIDSANGSNPQYTIRYSDELDAIVGFSKTLEHPSVPSRNFMAIMTCADADENCPIVPGADVRFRLTYDDPKVSDNTPIEAETYDARCRQIATEMLFLFSSVK